MNRSTLSRPAVIALVTLRLLMAVFFVGAAINKWQQSYITSDRLQRIFLERLEEIDPESFGAWFLEHVGILHYQPFAWLVCWGETFIGLGLLFGFMSRGAAVGAMLMMLSFAMGGYYDASLIVLTLMFLPLVWWPAGHHAGLDAIWHRRHPQSILFR
jgi:thiosulfate dehydrogenase [quinone] large subunit